MEHVAGAVYEGLEYEATGAVEGAVESSIEGSVESSVEER